MKGPRSSRCALCFRPLVLAASEKTHQLSVTVYNSISEKHNRVAKKGKTSTFVSSYHPSALGRRNDSLREAGAVDLCKPTCHMVIGFATGGNRVQRWKCNSLDIGGELESLFLTPLCQLTGLQGSILHLPQLLAGFGLLFLQRPLQVGDLERGNKPTRNHEELTGASCQMITSRLYQCRRHSRGKTATQGSELAFQQTVLFAVSSGGIINRNVSIHVEQCLFHHTHKHKCTHSRLSCSQPWIG